MQIRFISEKGVRAPRISDLAEKGIRMVFRHEKINSKNTVNVIWGTRQSIRSLNRRFRGKNLFTDVIAFRYQGIADSPKAQGKNPFCLPRKGQWETFGDIYISLDQAKINAERFNVSYKEELLRLSVHGALHLLGYTDYVPHEKKKMWDVQEKIVFKCLRSKKK